MASLKFMYVLKLLPPYQDVSNWTEETNKILSEHFNYLERLKEEGQVILAGRTDYSIENPENFGISIFRANDLEAATRLMNNDPCVKNKIMPAELHPFVISLLAGI